MWEKTYFESGSVSQTGADPEIFVLDNMGKLLPAFRFLPPKNQAILLPGSGGSAYWDGFQAEFAIGASGCHSWVTDYLHYGLVGVLKEARKVDPKARLTLQNVFRIPREELFTTSGEYAALGCNPSRNAYNTNPFMIDNPFELPYRMAGGHIHLGMDPNYTLGGVDSPLPDRFAKYLDFLVAIPTVGMFAEIDSPVRRKYYGRAGEYRLPSHGLEYRTLSNAWLGHPSISNLILDLARIAVGSITKIPFEEFKTTQEDIRDIINNTDVKGARKLFEQNSDLWKRVLTQKYPFKEGGFPKLQKAVNEGVEAIIPTYTDIEFNWQLQSSRHHAGEGTWSHLISKA